MGYEDLDKTCEQCDKDFTSYVETICDDCICESEQERQDLFNKLTQDKAALVKALKFYADADEDDGGETAREALKSAGEEV
jgi:predicted amidophosphoribosyltransferase